MREGRNGWAYVGRLYGRAVYRRGDVVGVEEDFRYLRSPTEAERPHIDAMLAEESMPDPLWSSREVTVGYDAPRVGPRR